MKPTEELASRLPPEIRSVIEEQPSIFEYFDGPNTITLTKVEQFLVDTQDLRTRNEEAYLTTHVCSWSSNPNPLTWIQSWSTKPDLRRLHESNQDPCNQSILEVRERIAGSILDYLLGENLQQIGTIEQNIRQELFPDVSIVNLYTLK